eukprot:3075191-Rhodomonas_salina.1
MRESGGGREGGRGSERERATEQESKRARERYIERGRVCQLTRNHAESVHLRSAWRRMQRHRELVSPYR